VGIETETTISRHNNWHNYEFSCCLYSCLQATGCCYGEMKIKRKIKCNDRVTMGVGPVPNCNKY
jgi:hypothetical protein